MAVRIAIFILLFTAFLAFCNMSVLTVLKKSRLFGGRYVSMEKRAGVAGRTGRTEPAGRSGRTAGSGGRFFSAYKRKLGSALKYGALDAGVDGVLRLKTLLAVLGFIAGVLIKNPLLAIVFLAGFFWLPDAYFRVTSLRYAQEADDAAEAAMSVITNSYLQNEDIKSAVLENISGIDPPLKEVFREFVAETGFVDASVRNALFRMRQKTDNAYFGDWCDILIQCQDDRELKYALPSIVARLNSVKKIQLELNTVMYDIYKEYLYVVGIVILNFPLMFLINAEWADILFVSSIGKLTVAVCFAIIFAASAYVVSVNRSLVRMN